MLEEFGVEYQIATVLTKLNDSIDNLEKIYHCIKDFKKLRRWEIRAAFRSLYSRDDFDLINISRTDIAKIDEWVEEIKKKTSLSVLFDNTGYDRYFSSDIGSRGFPGGRCSANYCNLVILPDGKATVCEQLYWTPQFIIGDLTKQSIEEVWNSPCALKLANPSKDDFREGSVCKSCNIFENCLSYNNRCVLDIVKAYGIENIDYPDPRCCKAPKFINNLQPVEE
jgi:radical SAM protein with 4Fe4S-binding SPASM domain